MWHGEVYRDFSRPWSSRAEIGLDMSRFPTAGHLASWARFAPGVKESAGRNKGNGSTGHGNPYLGRVLGEAVVSAGRTSTCLLYTSPSPRDRS